MNNNNQNMPRKKKMQRLGRLLIVVFAFLLLVSGVTALFITLVFKVTSYKIVSEAGYSDEEFIEATGDLRGRNLLFIGCDDIKTAVEKKLPYSDNVKVSKKLPGTIVIKCSKANPTYALQTSDSSYLIINEKMKVLKASAVLPEKLIVIRGVTPLKTEYGERLVADGSVAVNGVITENKENTVEILEEFASAFKENSLTDINEINLVSKNSIFAIYRERIVVKFGDDSDIAEKIALAARALKQENGNSDRQTGILNVASVEKAVFAAKDFKTIDELVEYMERQKPKEDEENTESTTETDTNSEETSKDNQQ